jgi:hypothetical protein
MFIIIKLTFLIRDFTEALLLPRNTVVMLAVELKYVKNPYNFRI